MQLQTTGERINTSIMQGTIFTRVCFSIHGGGGACMTGMCVAGGGGVGHGGRVGRVRARETATEAAGMHPSGMHSCYRPRSEASAGYVFTGVCHSFCS